MISECEFIKILVLLWIVLQLSNMCIFARFVSYNWIVTEKSDVYLKNTYNSSDQIKIKDQTYY